MLTCSASKGKYIKAQIQVVTHLRQHRPVGCSAESPLKVPQEPGGDPLCPPNRSTSLAFRWPGQHAWRCSREGLLSHLLAAPLAPGGVGGLVQFDFYFHEVY